MPKKYMTVAELADTYGWTEKSIWQRIYRGQMPHRRWGRRVLIPVAELEQFLAALPGRTAEEAALQLDDGQRMNAAEQVCKEPAHA